MADGATKVRAEAIEGFATVLSQLRDSAGRPSFRAMSGRSRAISHTTLHEAVQGNRLPSWGTTAEFVKACGADPAEYRERWEQANRATCSAGGPSAGRAEHVPVLPAAPPSPPTDADPGRHRTRYVALAAAAAGLLATGIALAWSTAGHDQPAASHPQGYAAGDCPVHQSNPPVQPPQHVGDRASLVADVTLSDCTHVVRGETVAKVWRFKNVGTVPWAGYTLHRVDLPQRRDQCQTISDVPIRDTAPGAMVDVRVEVSAPSTATFCFVRFKMVDASGKVAFPGSRPVNFQVIVD